MKPPIKDFVDGSKSQRNHLNELVKAVNDHEKRLVALENKQGNPLTMVVRNADNTRMIQVLVKDALKLRDLGDIPDCKCPDSGSSGGDLGGI